MSFLTRIMGQPSLRRKLAMTLKAGVFKQQAVTNNADGQFRVGLSFKVLSGLPIKEQKEFWCQQVKFLPIMKSYK